jgi:hypothetical protein
MLAANELALVVVDTSAAYFETDDENNNMQALAHAKRLRELSRLPSGLTVLICCLSTTNAESLVPRGGGALLNKVDGKPPRRRMAGEVWPAMKESVRSGRPLDAFLFEPLDPFANGLRGRVKLPRNSRFGQTPLH